MRKRYNRLRVFKTKKWFFDAIEQAGLPERTYYDWLKKGRIDPVPRRLKLNRCGESIISGWNNKYRTEWNPEAIPAWVKSVLEEKKRGEKK